MPGVSLWAIPVECREMINTAEAQTPAAKDRQTRLLGYGIGAGVSLALGMASAAAVAGNPAAISITENLPGGSGLGGCAVDTLAAAFFGTFVYLELQTAETNRERIYEELLRKKGGGSGGSSKGGGEIVAEDTKKKKKRKRGGRGKRMGEIASLSTDVKGEEAVEEQVNVVAEEEKEEKKEKKSILDAAKDFYKQADDMAASQALLLNKELEDRGLLEKITDETGLRIVGREGGGKGSSPQPVQNTGWADPDWNWGSAVGKAHDLAMELRSKLNKSEEARLRWLSELEDDESMIEEAKLALGLRVQRARWQDQDGDGRGWSIMERMVDLEYEGAQGKEKLRVDCEELAEYVGVGEMGEGGNEVGKAVGRALKAMNFVKDGL